MIKALFCTNNLVGSLLISWGTKEPWQAISDTPSHVAFLFFNTIVVDSDLISGVKESTFEDLQKKYKIVKTFILPVTPEESYRYLELARNKIIGSKYDWPAIIYFSWRVALKKLFNIPIPDKNKLAVPNMHFCTEVYNIIAGGDHGMVSPNDLMLYMDNIGYKIIELGKKELRGD